MVLQWFTRLLSQHSALVAEPTITTMLDEFAEYTVGPLRNGLHYLGTGSVELPYIGHTAAIAISALFVALPHFSATSKDHSLLAACVFVMQAFASATVSSLLLGVPNTVLVHSAAVIVSIAMWIVFSSSSIFSRILLSTPASHVLRALGAANTAVGITSTSRSPSVIVPLMRWRFF